jgi:hypothetical protein
MAWTAKAREAAVAARRAKGKASVKKKVASKRRWA